MHYISGDNNNNQQITYSHILIYIYQVQLYCTLSCYNTLFLCLFIALNVCASQSLTLSVLSAAFPLTCLFLMQTTAFFHSDTAGSDVHSSTTIGCKVGALGLNLFFWVTFSSSFELMIPCMQSKMPCSVMAFSVLTIFKIPKISLRIRPSQDVIYL